MQPSETSSGLRLAQMKPPLPSAPGLGGPAADVAQQSSDQRVEPAPAADSIKTSSTLFLKEQPSNPELADVHATEDLAKNLYKCLQQGIDLLFMHLYFCRLVNYPLCCVEDGRAEGFGDTVGRICCYPPSFACHRKSTTAFRMSHLDVF